MANPSRTLFIISDRTGITLENLVRTLITQFDDLCCERVVLPFLDTPAKGADLDIMIETRDARHAEEIVAAIENQGFSIHVLDASGGR